MTYTITACSSIHEIGQAKWDACANPRLANPASTLPFDPFISFAFLSALEDSGSATARTGWAPQHLSLVSASGAVEGVVPMYLKGHSQGEYVFDHSWADAFERAGGRYYPKLQVAVPFSPVTGRRLLTLDSANSVELEQYLASGMMQLAEKLGISSVHVTFAAKPQWQRLGEAGFLQRTHNQFHWQNQGYSCFEDFLGQLSAKKRKNIRRERRDALSDGVEIEWLQGAQIQEHHWDAFYQFYVDTGGRKWGTPYLTREFFSLVGASMSDDVLLIMCKRGGRYIGGAINFVGSECLYGRNWGCTEDVRFLHFEACYYQAIDYAIEHGLDRVEAGAQGQHKLARGYLPSHTYSAHWLANKSFSDAVGNFLDEENRYIDEEIDFLQAHSPFKQVES
jgi:predicted N-acyltransferase